MIECQFTYCSLIKTFFSKADRDLSFSVYTEFSEKLTFPAAATQTYVLNEWSHMQRVGKAQQNRSSRVQ